ncbi:hypothetical protein D3C77_679120 [compost metagenome]
MSLSFSPSKNLNTAKYSIAVITTTSRSIKIKVSKNIIKNITPCFTNPTNSGTTPMALVRKTMYIKIWTVFAIETVLRLTGFVPRIFRSRISSSTEEKSDISAVSVMNIKMPKSKLI